jgi:hypothetical protein
MSKLALVVTGLSLSVLVLLLGFVLLGTFYAVIVFRRRTDGTGPAACDLSADGTGWPAGALRLSRRRFLGRTGGQAATVMGALIGGWLLGSPAFSAGQGQCTSCVYGSGDTCGNAYSEVVPGCPGQCPPKQGDRLCSQRCFAC